MAKVQKKPNSYNIKRKYSLAQLKQFDDPTVI